MSRYNKKSPTKKPHKITKTSQRPTKAHKDLQKHTQNHKSTQRLKKAHKNSQKLKKKLTKVHKDPQKHTKTHKNSHKSSQKLTKTHTSFILISLIFRADKFPSGPTFDTFPRNSFAMTTTTQSHRSSSQKNRYKTFHKNKRRYMETPPPSPPPPSSLHESFKVKSLLSSLVKFPPIEKIPATRRNNTLSTKPLFFPRISPNHSRRARLEICGEARKWAKVESSPFAGQIWFLLWATFAHKTKILREGSWNFLPGREIFRSKNSSKCGKWAAKWVKVGCKIVAKFCEAIFCGAAQLGRVVLSGSDLPLLFFFLGRWECGWGLCVRDKNDSTFCASWKVHT